MKKAIIIGASSGIGRAVASLLVEKGWRIAITARRLDALDELRVMYGADRVTTMAMDVTKAEATTTLDTLLGEFGSPDLLFYASGIGGQNPELDIEKELDIIRTNCEGMVRVVDHFVNYVRSSTDYNKRHKAHIAIITSVAGTRGI